MQAHARFVSAAYQAITARFEKWTLCEELRDMFR